MENNTVELLSKIKSASEEVAPDVLLMRLKGVNCLLVGDPLEEDPKWILVDAGLESSFDYIVRCAKKRFGKSSKPQAIILTHGHFDQIGSLRKLIKVWDTVVYAHEQEIPYLAHKKDYPLADASGDEGLGEKKGSKLAYGGLDIGDDIRTLPSDYSVPGLKEWKWLHTPGHTAGHISLFKESNKTLIAGDALSLVQEAINSIFTRNEEWNGFSFYLIPDMAQAKESIKRLKELKPKVAILSHGKSLTEEDLLEYLANLSNHFEEMNLQEPL